MSDFDPRPVPTELAAVQGFAVGDHVRHCSSGDLAVVISVGWGDVARRAELRAGWDLGDYRDRNFEYVPDGARLMFTVLRPSGGGVSGWRLEDCERVDPVQVAAQEALLAAVLDSVFPAGAMMRLRAPAPGARTQPNTDRGTDTWPKN